MPVDITFSPSPRLQLLAQAAAAAADSLTVALAGLDPNFALSSGLAMPSSSSTTAAAATAMPYLPIGGGSGVEGSSAPRPLAATYGIAAPPAASFALARSPWLAA